MESLNYLNPVKVKFGCGSRKYLLNKIKNLKILIVTTKRGKKFIESDPYLSKIIKGSKFIDSITSNPSLDSIQKEINKNNFNDIEAIIAFGGGSSIDAAKAISACISHTSNSNKLCDLIVNPNKFLSKSLIPIYAIPTTSGTGSEVTPFATIWDDKNKKKLSLSHKNLYPQFAIVDPELTYEVPYEITVSTGLDALNQSLESIWNKNKNTLTITYATKSINRAFEALPRLHRNLKDMEARQFIAEASLYAGLAISKTRTAICHSISYPLTAKYGVMHGIACSYTMLSVARVIKEYKPNCFIDILDKLNMENPDQLINKIEEIVSIFEVKKIVNKSFKNKNEILSLIDEMITPGRSDNFILPINKKFIREIIYESF